MRSTRFTRATQSCTFGIQLKNHEKRFWQASPGRSTRHRKRSYQTAAAMPGEVAKRGCARARCSTSESKDYADSNDNRSALKNSAKFRQTFSNLYNFILKICLSSIILVQNSQISSNFDDFFRNFRKFKL